MEDEPTVWLFIERQALPDSDVELENEEKNKQPESMKEDINLDLDELDLNDFWILQGYVLALLLEH